MTASCISKHKKGNLGIIKFFLCIALFVFAFLYSAEIKAGVIYGIRICVYNIIPSLFPFFVLSDLWKSTALFNKCIFLEETLGKLCGLSGEGISIFILGNICGFPLGAKTAAEKYENHIIDINELKALTTLSNNPSAAFVISGVGLGLFGDLKVGIILYFSVIISSVIVNLITLEKQEYIPKTTYNSRQTFNLIDSVKSAGYTSITVSSYIIFFSAIIGAIKSIVKFPLLFSLFSSFLEVGSACSIISENREFLGYFTLPLISFSLAFSGISVFMQVFSILPKSISKKAYLFNKLLQGIISATITLLLTI